MRCEYTPPRLKREQEKWAERNDLDLSQVRKVDENERNGELLVITWSNGQTSLMANPRNDPFPHLFV